LIANKRNWLRGAGAWLAGKVATMARRHGRDWFIVVIGGGAATRMTLSRWNWRRVVGLSVI